MARPSRVRAGSPFGFVADSGSAAGAATVTSQRVPASVANEGGGQAQFPVFGASGSDGTVGAPTSAA